MDSSPLTDLVYDLFNEALEQPSSERNTWLKLQTKGNTQLLEEVSVLLKGFEEAQSFFSRLDGDIQQVLEKSQAQDGLLESTVGVYQLTEILGKGGMATVYKGIRIDGQFDQTVAVKVLKKGLDTEHLLQRFAREKRMLGNLNHPNISRILDAGMLPDERPYFIMEFLSGKQIDQFVKEKGFSQRKIVMVFRKVVEAVAFANSMLIVHLDIKPGNILVDEYGEPHLLDFGIASLLEKEAETNPERKTLLTPAYAAPEQLKKEPVSQATDVYQLGLVLYEMLHGTRHAHRKEGSDWSIKSSNDLEVILRKSLQERPEDRYSSAESLKQDLDAYLEKRPVRAQRQTVWYPIKKYLERNRIYVAFSLLVMAVLVGGLISTSIQAKRAKEERDKSEEISDLLIDFFGSPNPYQTLAPEEISGLTVVSFLTDRYDQIRIQFADRPNLQLELLERLYPLYQSWEIRPQTQQLADQIYLLAEQKYGSESPELLPYIELLAGAVNSTGNFAKTDSLLEAYFHMAEQNGQTPSISSLALEAGLYVHNWDVQRADSLFKLTLTIPASTREDSIDLALAAGNYGSMKYMFQQFEEAIIYLEQSRSIIQKTTPEGSKLEADALSALVPAYLESRQLDSARQLSQQVCQYYRRILPPGSEMLFQQLHTQAIIEYFDNDYAKAVDMLQRLVLEIEHTEGTAYRVYWEASYVLGTSLIELDQLVEAEKFLRKAIAIGIKENHPTPFKGIDYANLGKLLLKKGQPKQAIEVVNQGIKAREGMSTKGTVNINFDGVLAQAYLDLNQPEQALPVYKRNLERAQKISNWRKEEYQSAILEGLVECTSRLGLEEEKSAYSKALSALSEKRVQ